MNTPVDSSTASSSSSLQDHGGGVSIGVTIGVLTVIIAIAITSYICNRIRMPVNDRLATSDNFSPTISQPPDHSIRVDIQRLTDAGGYPRLGLNYSNTTRSCCSICLADYKGTDRLKLLPECRHLFHAKCIEQWLKLHPTCPICRSSPLPTPLAEVAPLAGSAGQSRI